MFLALTAIDPLTLVYFFAPAGFVATISGAGPAPVVFIAAAGSASLLWRFVLVVVGSVLRASVPRQAVDLLGMAASIVVIGLGAAVIVTTAVAGT